MCAPWPRAHVPGSATRGDCNCGMRWATAPLWTGGSGQAMGWTIEGGRVARVPAVGSGARHMLISLSPAAWRQGQGDSRGGAVGRSSGKGTGSWEELEEPGRSAVWILWSREGSPVLICGTETSSGGGTERKSRDMVVMPPPAQDAFALRSLTAQIVVRRIQQAAAHDT